MTCDRSINEHERGDPPCDDPRHVAALTRRWHAGALPWLPIVRGKDGGGMRDFLDGEPISCGSVLLLQGVTDGADDYGEYTLFTHEAVVVTYELDVERRVVLYTGVQGHTFSKLAEPWMRFRRPNPARRRGW